MTALAQTWRKVTRRGGTAQTTEAAEEVAATISTVEAPSVEIAPNDPLVAYLQSAGGAVDVESLELESPGVTALREAGVALVVPLISGGELVGTLNLGPRLSDQQYSTDDKRLLDGLAAQAAPALQVAELVQKQAAEARSRERIEQELKVATLIQQNFLPRVLPDLPGWEVAAYYQPAREVGGDFYDLFELPDGQVAVIIGDVTDKGVPAAMVMAAARSLLRASGQRVVSPGEVLERVNDLLCPDIPEKMFVTCLYLVVDPSDGSRPLRERGSQPAVRAHRRRVDGAARQGHAARAPARDEVRGARGGDEPRRRPAALQRRRHRGARSRARDVRHAPPRRARCRPRVGRPDRRPAHAAAALHRRRLGAGGRHHARDAARTLGERRPERPRHRASTSGSRCRARPATSARRCSASSTRSRPLGLEARRVERLGTAVSEAAMNAIEHGNQGRAEIPVEVEVVTAGGELIVRICDVGDGPQATDVESPDIEAKLAGLQKPRGWGLFLIENMVDEIRVIDADGRHTVELVLQLEGGDDDGSDGA